MGTKNQKLLRKSISHKGQNPWRKLSTESAFRNPWINLRKDAVIRPDGIQGEYSFLEVVGYCGVLPIDEEGHVYLVGQYRYPTDTYSWEIPIGGVQKGEDPVLAAGRELQEELGIYAQRLEPVLHAVQGAAGYSNERFYGYIARELAFGADNPDGTEVLERARIHLTSAIDAVMNGEISELRTIAMLLAVARYKP